MTKLKSITLHQYILFGILVLGIILRFWNFSELPFTHDEFSALDRLHFDSFSELIAKGVKIDAHPAGVHVFMYYWVQLFGFSEIAVKFPFILMGIGSIYLIYNIGKSWFNSSVGLISAAFMATMQFPIMYSQIARPYISGMFLCLLMVVYWSKIIKAPENNFWKNYIGFIASAALCAYNHHFSLLFAAVVGVSGVFFIPKKYLIKYVLSGVAIFILYLPHLSIFFYQLHIGGVGSWLGKPEPDFLIEFIKHLFHFSPIIYLLVIVMITGGIYLNKERKISKYFVLSVIWFVLPFLIGYYYSLYHDAVLQYSVLIFSFPFFFFILFSFVPKLPIKILFPVIILISVLNSYSLIFERAHYKLFYQNRFMQFLVDTQQKVDELGKENCTVLLVNHARINEYYVDKLDFNFNYFNFLERGKEVNYKDLSKVVEYLKGAKTDYFIYGGVAYAPEEIHSMIKEFYPALVHQKNYYASKLEVFSKEKLTEDEYCYSNILDFETINSNWNYNQDKVMEDAFSDSHFLLIDSLSEYVTEHKILLNKFDLTPNDVIDLSVKVYFPQEVKETVLVGTIEQNDSTHSWKGAVPAKFNLQEREWQTMHLSIDIRKVDLSIPNLLKVYFWNKDKINFKIDDFSVKIRKGNPNLYGLTEKLLRN